MDTGNTYFDWILKNLESMRLENYESSTLSDSPLEAPLNQLLEACATLSGANPLNLKAYPSVYKKIQKQKGVLSNTVEALTEKFTSRGLDRMSEVLEHLPNEPSDIDILVVQNFILPIFRHKILGEPLRGFIDESLTRMSKYPVVSGGVFGFEHILANRIVSECVLTHYLMNFAGFDWEASAAYSHTLKLAKCIDWRYDPQAFAKEAIAFMEIRKEASTTGAATEDYDSGSYKVHQPEGDGSNVRDAREKTLQAYLASTFFRENTPSNIHYKDLPTAEWSKAKTLLTINGNVVIEFSSARGWKRLLQVREALKLSQEGKTRMFNLEDIHKNILKRKEKMGNGKPVTFSKDLNRFRADGFKRKQDQFDALFRINKEGLTSGDYLINVRLESH